MTTVQENAAAAGQRQLSISMHDMSVAAISGVLSAAIIGAVVWAFQANSSIEDHSREIALLIEKGKLGDERLSSLVTDVRSSFTAIGDEYRRALEQTGQRFSETNGKLDRAITLALDNQQLIRDLTTKPDGQIAALTANVETLVAITGGLQRQPEAPPGRQGAIEPSASPPTFASDLVSER